MTESRISVKCSTQSDRKQKVWIVLFTNHKICFTLLRCLYVPHLLQGALICFTCSNSLYHCGLIWFWIGVTGAPRRLYFYACTPLAFLFGACDWCLVLKCGKKCKFTNIERNSEKPVGWLQFSGFLPWFLRPQFSEFLRCSFLDSCAALFLKAERWAFQTIAQQRGCAERPVQQVD